MSDERAAQYLAVKERLTAPGASFAIEYPNDPQRRRMVGSPESIAEHLFALMQRHAEHDLIASEGKRFTYAEIDTRATRLAAGLAHSHRINPGDRIGIAMHNSPAWFVALFAILRLGGVATLLNSRAAPVEVIATAQQTGCALILADERCAERLQRAAAIEVIDPAAQAALERTDAPETAIVSRMADDPALIVFTSGTTGHPKGATLTQRNLCSLVQTMRFVAMAGATVAAESFGAPVEAILGMMPRPSQLMIFPMFHISGITNMLVAMDGGGLMTLMRRWDPAQALDLIAANRVTQITGPSMIFTDLLDQPDHAAKMGSLLVATVGGQATPPALFDRIRASLPSIQFGGGWGMSETTGISAGATPGVFAEQPLTVGLPTPLVEIRIVDNQLKPLQAGAIGEIEVRGPNVMSGYWDDPAANDAAFNQGWLRTGDVGTIDGQGRLFILDRTKEMVVCAGENIYCAEVERVLSTIENQHEVALFGVPDDRLGERAIAAVVLRRTAEPLDAAAVRDHVRTQLADYKVPAEVHFDLGPLPRNGLGKVDKRALAERYHERSSLSQQRT